MAKRIVHFILHVPRSAGTTVERHFEAHLGDRFRYPPRWGSLLRNIVGNRYPHLDADDLAGVDVLSGHSLSTSLRHKFPGAEIRESLLIRDPLSWHLSLYNLRWTRFREGLGPKPPGFESWYIGQRRNPITRFLLNRYFEFGVPEVYKFSSAGRLAFLEDRLKGFYYVGAHGTVGDLIHGLSAELGIPDAAQHFGKTDVATLTAEQVSDRMHRRIATDNMLDQALFDRWGDRGWAQGDLPPPPALARFDQVRYLWGDALSGIWKSLPTGA